MRLIDADALLEAYKKLLNDYYRVPQEKIHHLITNAPTIQREGWVNVPIEPTHEMITRAFHLAQNPNMLIKDMYKAMVQAAPIDKAGVDGS